jgi:hypothetical protein
MAGALIMVAGVISATAMAYQKKSEDYAPQQLSFSVEQFGTCMKTMGLAFELAQRAIGKNDAGNAKDFLSRSREQLAISIAFWRQRNDDSAMKMTRAALKSMDDLDSFLSAGSADKTAVDLSAKRVVAACEACHGAYREQDPATKSYRLKTTGAAK